MKWYISVLKNYATFSGRARRSEYWYFVLFNFLFSLLAIFIDNVLGLSFDLGGLSLQYGFTFAAYYVAMFIPSLAVLVRRLHDVGKSGWMFLVVLIPLIGAIWLLILLFSDSQSGNNKWGANPKYF